MSGSKDDKAYRDYAALVARETRQRAPGHQQSQAPKRTVLPPDSKGRRVTKVVKPKPPPPPYRKPASAPGSRQQPPKQKGKGAK
jgi:hypothetical protein